MQRLRQPAVAGTFYPADPGRLRAMIAGFLARVAAGGAPPRAIIAPHAGYAYSGLVAAAAYARLALARTRIRRVLLVGPSHRLAFRGLAVPEADAFATPLGRVPVDPEALAGLLELPFVRRLEAAHAREHSLEVQLPFLQAVLGEFTLVPLLVGEASPAEVAAALDRRWEPGTAVVASSDLSHYLDQAAARRLDQASSDAIVALRPEALDGERACGHLAVRGLLLAARRRGLRAELLDLRNSGDTAGGTGRVVGYGAYAFA